MSDDLVKRLRIGIGDAVRDHHLMREAADRIEALEEELAEKQKHHDAETVFEAAPQIQVTIQGESD